MSDDTKLVPYHPESDLTNLKKSHAGHTKYGENVLEFYRAVSWLLDQTDESRASGRSTVMALAFIDQAVKNPGKRVHLHDHYVSDTVTHSSRSCHGSDLMAQTVGYLLKNYPELEKRFEITRFDNNTYCLIYRDYLLKP